MSTDTEFPPTRDKRGELFYPCNKRESDILQILAKLPDVQDTYIRARHSGATVTQAINIIEGQHPGPPTENYV